METAFKIASRVIVPLVVIAAVGWWFSFGTFSPCDALHAEARRVSAAEAGFFGKLVGGVLTDIQTDDFTPW